MMEIETESIDRKSQKNRVRVAIRVRPMIARQIVNNDKSSLTFQSDNEIIINDTKYHFDKVFTQNSRQCQVYQQCVKDLVLKCFDGYNAAILAYGQTGSGKTFTMGTATSNLDNPQNKGIIPRVINDIFDQIDQKKHQTNFNVKVSFLQIYNEQIIDLLSDTMKSVKNRDSGITIRQQKDGSVSINGAVEQTVTDAEQMAELLQKGGMHRTTASTLMNEASSRSHSIFTMVIQQHSILKDKKSIQQQGYITAKFVFVDLAGSQRIKKTGATGVTLKQGININLGLLQLGNVISALANINKKQQQFITYRNSKLTRILQDSLGGNSNTYMIACISPSDFNMQESLNTIKYASKAMNIKNKPIVNRDPHTAMITQFKQKINELQLENRKLKQLLTQSGIKNIEQQVSYSRDLTSDELKRMKQLYIGLQKKNEQLTNELREQKKKKNQLQIQNYQIKRQKDILNIKLQQIKKIHPNIIPKQDYFNHKITVLQQHLSKIQQLENSIFDKQRLNNQLQQQYQKLRKASQKDQKILIEKNNLIYNLQKNNKKLKNQNHQLKLKFDNGYIKSQSMETEKLESNQDGIEQLQVFQDQQQIQLDGDFTEKQQNFEKIHQQTETQLKNVDKYIEQKQQCLKQMTTNQIQLQYQLIAQMKQQYHQKISLLQKQKQHLILKQKDEGTTHDKIKYKAKIDNLQNQLKQYRRKIKQQSNMEKVVSNQNIKIKDLANQIKKFKVQKIQLSRKLKQDKDNFQKFKSEKIKIILKSKKQNIQKDAQIRKLTYQNRRNVQLYNKKTQELQRTKRFNQTLKSILKPNRKHNQVQNQAQLQQKNYQKIIQNSLKNILYEIDRNIEIERYEKKMSQIQKQLHQLLNEQSLARIKLQRMKLEDEINQSEETVSNQEKLNICIRDLKQRISNCQENFEFCKKRHQSIIKNVSSPYQIDVEIIFNKNFANVEAMRGLLKCLYRSVKSILSENYQLREIIEKAQVQINGLKYNIQEFKEQVLVMNSQHQANLTKMREQMLMKCYGDDEPQLMLKNTNINTNRLQQKQRKEYQRKILDLIKANRHTTNQVEMWRRKCTIIEQKYRSIRNLINKDKFIGRPFREQDNTHQKDKKAHSTTQLNLRSNYMLDQVNQLTDNFNNLQSNNQNRNKKNYGYQEGNEYIEKMDLDYNFTQQQPQFNKNKWQCLFKIDAHNTQIFSLVNYSNFLISSATKSLKIWDIETQKNVTQLGCSHFSGLVRNVIVYPERKMIITACEKNISIWDLLTLKMEMSLKAHKQEIKALHIAHDYLFSGGKGLPNSGSLLIWDFRNLNPNCPMQQKERNQDIFTMTSNQNTLYYGTRNHQIRKMNLENMEILPPFQPPHMDAVTGVCVMNNYLISGSKDKNLRLWSLDSPINNIKFTVHAFNDYINNVTSDVNLPIFYTGARDGQVKIGAIRNEKIEVIGGITSHSQSVNAITPIQQSSKGHIATASSDKTVKLWQPTNQTLHHIQSYF